MQFYSSRVRRGGAAAIIAVAALISVLWFSVRWIGDDPAAMAASRVARADAGAAGFKLSYDDFHLTLDENARHRFMVMTNAGSCWKISQRVRQMIWMRPAGPGVAICGWRANGPWEEAEASLRPLSPAIETAVSALLEPGGFRCEPLRQTGDSLLPHLAHLMTLSQALTMRMALDLRSGSVGGAWTNLLAVNALAARYQPEPAVPAHLVRGRLAKQAFAATWEALRTNVWSDAQLATLVDLWEPVRLMEGVDDIPALLAAGYLETTAAFREECRTNQLELNSLRLGWSVPLRNPGGWLGQLTDEVRYHSRKKLWARRDSYWDEVQIITFHQERRRELKQATEQPSWQSMRLIPGMTNPGVSQIRISDLSPVQSLVSIRALLLASMLNQEEFHASFPRAMAGVESLRRVLLSALAIERFRLKSRRLPDTLTEVVGIVPDFTDGGSLRYRPAPDGTFVLYSVGTDEQDDGGTLGQQRGMDSHTRGQDLVWPRAATPEEAIRH